MYRASVRAGLLALGLGAATMVSAEVRVSQSNDPTAVVGGEVARLLQGERAALRQLSPEKVANIANPPAPAPARSAGKPVVQPAVIRFDPDWLAAQPPAKGGPEWSCLTKALYHEARGESLQGRVAVAEVILNRVDHPRFPKTVCGVVNQRGQFTYNKNARIREKGTYARVQRVAMAALAGAPRTLTNGATYFHARGVSPSWSKRFERTIRIGSHTVYRSDRRLASN